MFPGCTVLPDNKQTKLVSSNQEASPSAGTNTGVVLVLRCEWKCLLTANVDNPEVLESHNSLKRSFTNIRGWM